MDAASFFERQAPRALDEAGPLFRLGTVYDFDLEGEGGGRWTLDLGAAQPLARRGGHPGPDCRIRLQSADFRQLLADPWGSRRLFYEGRIRVEGRLQAAAHLPGVLHLLTVEPLAGGLQALLGPFPQTRFLEERWPERSLVVHAPPERLADAGLPRLGTLEELLERWPGRVRLGDRRGGRLVSPAEARRLHAAGEHLAFSDVEHVVPPLRGWLERLRWELDLPISCHGRCLVYASPAGAGEVLHFDQNVNFVVQLGGEKHWRTARNRHVRRPTARYTSLAPPEGELLEYASLPLPTEMPAEAEVARLRPGSLLFLPRGEWHETRATEASLSLNFTFDQPCWADLMPPDLRPALLRDERWRDLARGAGAPRRAAAAAAEATLRELVAARAPELQGFDAAAAIARLLPAGSENPTEAVGGLAPAAHAAGGQA